MKLAAVARAEQAAKVLRELGSAWRGDWSEFDGRTLRTQIGSWIDDVLAVALDDRNHSTEELEERVRAFRVSCGLCPDGIGEWVQNCGWSNGHDHGEETS